MHINNFTKGIYIIFYDNDIDIGLNVNNNDDTVFINFNIQNSITVNSYFRKNKLEFSSNLIKSYSNAPQETFSVVVDLLAKNKTIIVGTVGLSYDSIAGIYFELKNILMNSEKTVFICHQRKIQKGDYTILTEDLLNENAIVNLFLSNSQ